MTTQSPKQQAIFPDLPRFEPLIDDKGFMTPSWRLYFENLTMALQTNLKPEGFVIPAQPVANFADLSSTLSYNNILYDSTNNAFKGNVAGTWKTFTLT